MPMALSFSYMMLLPAARSLALVGAPINTVTMILRTMNAIPRRFLPADRNPIECLLLPIPAIIKSTTLRYKLAKKPKSATVGDIFELQTMLNFASFRKGLHIQPSHDNFAYSQGRTLNFRHMFLEATERRLPATQAIAASSWKAF
ncbi:hypothetical protein BD408DRAFT_399069 [Parasitella parasitica]|nr:hypothetical protein BD408DRAFT_399069 [Parasitella parasitica]